MHELPLIPITPAYVLACEWAFVSLAAVFVSLRIYVRARQRLFIASDYTIVFTLLCFIITATCDTVMVKSGFSDETLNLNPGDPNSAYVRLPSRLLHCLLKMLYASSIPYYTSLWLVKATLLLLYYQLIPRDYCSRKLRAALKATSVTVGVTYVVMLAVNMFWCIPLSRNWDTDFRTPESAKEQRYCVAYYASETYIISVTLHAFTEVMVFALPWPLLRVLKFNKHMFRAVAAVFAVGSCGLFVSLARVAYSFLAQSGAVVGAVQAWAAAEQSVGIVVCCLPALKKLISTHGTVVGSSRDSGTVGIVGDIEAHRSMRTSPMTSRSDLALREPKEVTKEQRHSVAIFTGEWLGHPEGLPAQADPISIAVSENEGNWLRIP